MNKEVSLNRVGVYFHVRTCLTGGPFSLKVYQLSIAEAPDISLPLWRNIGCNRLGVMCISTFSDKHLFCSKTSENVLHAENYKARRTKSNTPIVYCILRH